MALWKALQTLPALTSTPGITWPLSHQGELVHHRTSSELMLPLYIYSGSSPEFSVPNSLAPNRSALIPIPVSLICCGQTSNQY